MASLEVQSTLLDDVLAHRAVSSNGPLAVAVDSAGIPLIVSVGTDGHTYLATADADSETGWKVVDLACPASLDVVATHSDGEGGVVICGGNQRSHTMYVLTMSPDGELSPWHQIDAGQDVTGNLTFYDVRLRLDDQGRIEFFLLYFQRMDDPQWHFTYRIGRASVEAATWSIGFNVDALYTGPTPAQPPCMTLRTSGGVPALSVWWAEGGCIRSWLGIDGQPSASEISLPKGSSVSGLLSPGPGPDSLLLLSGVIGEQAGPGIYRWSEASAVFELVSAGHPVSKVSGTYTTTTGFDVMSVSSSGGIYHVHGSPDGATWGPFDEIGSRGVEIAGVGAPELGPVFIAATIDKSMRHYARSSESVDWEVEEINTSTGTASEVVWYTSKVAVLNADARAIGGQQVLVSCPEATEVLINGRPDVVGPGRSLELETSPIGNLVIQQSTAELSNLYVPQLKISLLTGEEGTLEAHEAVRDRLYALTGAELSAATGRDGKAVLPEAERGNAPEIATQLATSASLGLAPAPGAQICAPDDPRLAPLNIVRFTPTGDKTALDMAIDIGDFFEWIKDGLVGAFTSVVTAVGDAIVTGLHIVVTTAEGLYTVFVNTMEHAFDAVRTVFESVGAAFETVLEWLGTLFDWSAITALAQTISSQMKDGIESIPQVLRLAGLPDSIGPRFDELRTSADGALDYIRTQIGASPAGHEVTSAGFSNPDSVYTVDGTSYSNEANWLLDRLTPNLGGMGAIFTLDGPGWAAVDGVSEAMGAAFLATGQNLANNFIQLFENLATTDDVLGVTIDAILDQLQAIVDGILSALEGITTSLVTAMESLATSNAITELLATPITFPVISDILAFLGLEDASILDLISYVVAIPMHVISTIVGNDLTAGTEATPSGVFLAVGIMFFFIMIVSAVNDALPEGKVLLSALLGVTWVAALSLVIYGTLKSDNPPIELVLAGILYLGYQFVGLRTAVTEPGPSATKKFAIYSIIDAVVMNVLAAVWAIRNKDDPDPNNRPKAWQIAANHIGTLPDIFRWADLVWTPPTPRPIPARIVLAGVDVVGMGALTAGAFADYAASLSAPEQGADGTDEGPPPLQSEIRPGTTDESDNSAGMGGA